MTKITFGTSGWRGILCEDFTFDNVKVVVQAIADTIKASGEGDKDVVIGCDTRFIGQRFVKASARVLAGAGIKAYICERDDPSSVGPSQP